MSAEQWAAARPALTPENEIAYSVWSFCEGWNPAALPLAAAFYGVEDLEALLEALLTMRVRIEAHKEAARKARGL